MLVGGDAKAASWVPSPLVPTFPPTGTASTSVDFLSIADLLTAGLSSPWVADKQVAYRDSANIPPTSALLPYNWEFAFEPTFLRPWETDLDFPGGGTINPGSFTYKIEISSLSNDLARCSSTFTLSEGCKPYFKEVELFGTIGAGTTGLAKEIFTDLGLTNKLTTLTPGSPIIDIFANFGPYSTLYVRDSWNPTGGAVVDQIGNRYNQTPGPLPILGAGAAFGFSRKLRSRIKSARNA